MTLEITYLQTNQNEDPHLPRDIQDEALVNVTLIQLLECIESLMEPAAPGWTINREVFCPEFRKAKYTAITDGALWTRIKHHVLGVIEVKKRERLGAIDKIRMQETSEMVAWMKTKDKRAAIFSGQ